MKQAIFFCLVGLLCCTKRAKACDDLPVYGKIISSEYMLNSNNIIVQWRFYFKETCKFKGLPSIKAAPSYTISCTNCIEEQIVSQEDSLTIRLTLGIASTNIPFYPQSFSFFQAFESVETPTLGIFTEESQGHYYFTPYETLEIWNDNDFYNIPRMWLHPANRLDTTHIAINAADIPSSNLDSTDVVVEGQEWTEEWTWKRVNGLPYLIPMKALSPDSIAYYSEHIGDGPNAFKTRGTYSGTVSGRLLTQITNDLGNPVTIPLAGIRVKLLEEDWYGFETFDEGYTDEQGYFNFNYDRWQTFEGGEVELLVQIKSKTKEDWNYKIKAKQNNFWQNIYEKKIAAHSSSGTNQTWNIGDIVENDDPYRTVHWARRSKQYVENNGFSTQFTSKLTLLLYRNGSSFIGDGAIIGSPFTDPTIRLTDNDGDRESVVMHEFGHFLMWELQDNTMITLYSTNNCQSHLLNAENTSRLAWVEGWAEAVGMILDAAYWQEDGEYGQRLTGQKVPLFENNVRFYADPFLPFNNGIRSEYNLATAIYDLWDGPNKNLPNQIPAKTNAVTISHGFNDQFISVSDPLAPEALMHWQEVDDVEYSFHDIMLPLIISPMINGGNIKHISEYYQDFLSFVLGSGCVNAAKVANIFRENRVVQDIDLYDAHAGNNCLNSDGIFRIIDFDEDAQVCPFGNTVIQNYQDHYVTNYFPMTQNETFNFAFSSGYYPYITDDLWLGNVGGNGFPVTSCDFLINGDNSFLTFSTGTLETCAGADIELNNANMILGNSSGLSATLILNQDSELKLTDQSILRIHNNSKVIIEPNAKLLYEPGAQIELLGNNAILEIRGNLELKDNAIFTFTGSGFVRFALPWKPTDNITVGNNCEIKLQGANANDKVLEIVDATYFSSYALAKTTIQNGRCELGKDVFWDTGVGAVLFDHATFTALHTNEPYNTIYTNGQGPLIHDCSFSYGKTGLTARNFGLGAGITLGNTEISYCETGLQSYDKGGDMYNVNFHNNITGWKQAYAAFNSTWHNSKAEHNSYIGLWYEGNTDLYLDKAQINGNEYGSVYQGNGTLQATCGSISSNSKWGLTLTDEGLLDIEGNTNSKPRVTISNNFYSIVGFPASDLRLKDGYNNLKPNSQTGSLAIIGLTSNPSSPLKIQHNHWNDRNPTNIYPNPGEIPAQGQDYDLDYVLGGAIYVADGTPIVYESCDGDIPSGERHASVADCETCRMISNVDFSNEPLDAAVQSIADDLYGEGGFENSVSNAAKLARILTYNFGSVSEEENQVLNDAWRFLKIAVADGVKQGEIVANPTGEMPTIATNTLNALDSRIQQESSSSHLFYLKMDKAILYNLLNRPEAALSALANLSSEEAIQNNFLQHWLCYLTLRKDLQEGSITYSNLTQRLAACPSLTLPELEEIQEREVAPHTNTHHALYPNPAKTQLTIQLHVNEASALSLNIYDISGRKIIELPNLQAKAGQNAYPISIEKLTEGMYFVELRLGNETIVEKFGVQN